MDQSAPATLEKAINRAKIEGDVHGQVIVGDKNLQIGSIHGGIVNYYAGEQRPRLQPKPTPVFVLPRRFDGLLDRTAERDRVQAAFPADRPIELYGPGGVGKTSLLQYLAHHTMNEYFRDGVIHLTGRNQSLGDLLQSIFDIFYDYSAPYKPSQGEIRQALRGKRALILLDDLDLDRFDRESLLDAAPDCTFLMASRERQLWGESEALPLGGLPEEDAMLLLSRHLGRPVTAQEVEAARKLFRAVDGYPLYLVQAAALVREQGYSLAAVVQSLEPRNPAAQLAEQALESATPEERKVLAAIGALDGEPLHARHLSSLAQITEVRPVIQRLLRRGLIQAHSPKFTMAGGMGAALEQKGELSRWRNWALDYFQVWAERQNPRAAHLVEEAGGLLRLVEWGLRSGQAAKALRLARAVEPALILNRRWDLWYRFLQKALRAARSLRDLPATAWALHQIGTHALCLGEIEIARRHLIRAYRLRQSLGDWAGAAVTRHNLDLLLPPPPSDSGSNPPRPPRNGGPNPATVKETFLMSVFMALGTIGVIALMLFPPPIAGFGSLPTATSTPSQIAVAVEPFTATPTLPPTDTALPPTSTATPVPQTDTATATRTASPSPQPPTAVPCAPRADWPVYTVRRGDTLWSIGQATGASAGELMAANCKDRPDIYTGERLRVPRLPPEPPEPLTDTLPTASPPDLVANLQVEQPVWSENGSLAAPFVVTVANQGGSPTGPFQLAVLVRSEALRAPAAKVIDSGDLPAGGRLSFREHISLNPELQGRTVEFLAQADFCTPDGGLTAACRVLESNEQNNQAGPVSITLPTREPNPQPPAAGIETPSEGMRLAFSGWDERGWFAILQAQGYAEDPEDGRLSGEALVWTDAETGEVLGTGEQPAISLYSDRCQVITRTITLTAVDSEGGIGTATRQVILGPEYECGPEVRILSPKATTYYYQDEDKTHEGFYVKLTAEAQAFDAVGKPLPDASLQWSIMPEGSGKPQSFSGNNLPIELTAKDFCAGATYGIAVTATDRDGLQDADAITVRITGKCSEVG